MAFEDELHFDQPHPETRPKSFEVKYCAGLLGERTRTTEAGGTTIYVAYRFFFQRGESADEQGLANFCLNALQAGYTEAMGPVIVPDTYAAPEKIREKRDNDELLSSVLFFLEKTAPQPEGGVPPVNEKEPPRHSTGRLA
jgi:hypothetical protein